MAWRLAKSLTKLREQINAAFPARDKTSDGTIGDTSHSARKSDHNPNAKGVVCAIDIDEDLNSDTTLQQVVDAICASRDPRVKYVIYEGRITVAGSELQRWKKYTGKNAHKHHAHISVHQDPKLYDSTAPWKIDVVKDSAAVPSTTPLQPTVPHIKEGGESDEQPPIELSPVQIDNVQQATFEAPKPTPSGASVTVKTERTSIFAKIAASFAAITALGINLGNVATTKLNDLTPQQIVWLVGACLLIAGALWFYDRAAQRAHEKTKAKMATAADPAQNTVELRG